MTKEEIKEKLGEIIYMYAHGVEEDAVTQEEAINEIMKLMSEEFERGRRDLFTFIKIMGTEFEGAFLLRKYLIDALSKELDLLKVSK